MAMYNLLVETFVEIFLKAINSVVHLYGRQHIGTYTYTQSMYLSSFHQPNWAHLRRRRKMESNTNDDLFNLSMDNEELSWALILLAYRY